MRKSLLLPSAGRRRPQSSWYLGLGFVAFTTAALISRWGTVLMLQDDDLGRHYPSITNNLPPRLELLHIPRTGGTILEVYAASNNISWGACHFEFRWKHNARNPLKECPDSLDSNQAEVKDPLWHYPLDILLNLTTTTNPYDNLRDSALRRRAKHFFVVIRNPYDKLISFFHKQHQRCSHNPNEFNEWIQMEIKATINNDICHNNCGATPQWRFVFDERNVQRVEHILHFENLQEEFQQLLQQYNYHDMPPLPTERVKNSKDCSATKMQVSDFSQESLDLIHRFYQRDFELGGYDMIKAPKG